MSTLLLYQSNRLFSHYFKCHSQTLLLLLPLLIQFLDLFGVLSLFEASLIITLGILWRSHWLFIITLYVYYVLVFILGGCLWVQSLNREPSLAKILIERALIVCVTSWKIFSPELILIHVGTFGSMASFWKSFDWLWLRNGLLFFG